VPPTAEQAPPDGTGDAQPGVMKDVVFVAVTFAFFGVAWLYARALDRL
jgi:hypothetical protein